MAKHYTILTSPTKTYPTVVQSFLTTVALLGWLIFGSLMVYAGLLATYLVKI